jgi:type II secretion system protein N
MRPTTSAGESRPGRLAALLRGRGVVLAYAAFTLLVFAVALVWSLPHDLIAARALDLATAGAPVRIGFATVSLAFPNGYHFTDVRVTPPAGSAPIATLSEVTVRVPVTGLLTGSFRQAVFGGRAYGGRFDGWARLSGGKVAGQIDARDVRLEPALAPFVPPPGRVQGVATLALRLSGDGRTTQSMEGEVSLGVRDLVLEQVSVRGFRLPDVAFPTVDAAAQVFGARLQVKQARAAGDDLTFDATGDVLLREPLQQSVLNLRMSLEVPPNAQPALRIATGLLPKRKPGEPPVYTVKGTIGAPVVR